MSKRAPILAFVALLATSALVPTVAKEPGQPVRIGWLSAGNMESHRPHVEAFREGMKNLGYTEGTNYVIDFHWGSDTFKSYTWMAHDMMGKQPDVIVATCEFTSNASLRVTKDVPIVLAISGDPVKLGYVKSMSNPGTNVTGVASISPVLAAKRLELLKEMLPQAKRIGVIHQPEDETARHGLQEAQAAARTLGVELSVFNVAGPKDYPRVFEAVRAAKLDGLLVLPGTQIAFINRRMLAQLALEARLPSSFPFEDFVEEGGLMSYGVNVRRQFARSASYVDRLVKGAKAADLPLEQPTHFELAANQRTAKTLGVTIPSSILLRADRVIE